ncbi:hypothetical protein [Streptomyces tendae]|uniref:hypothetical protein n=1 Tax=Streptomyces tendae TaxID=1932 RepID=UPI003D73E4D5
MRIGPFEIIIRRRHNGPPCGACQGRGLFHTKGAADKYPAPEGYDGVALCGCGTAHDRLADQARESRRWRREQRRGVAPF